MELLTRDQILNAQDLDSEDVAVPEWGGTVRVRALSGAERDNFEASITERKGRKTRMNLANLRARLVQLCVVDQKGKSLFRRTDIDALGKKSAAALDRVFDVCRRLSGMTEEDIEEMTENFTETQGDASATS